MSVHVRPLVLEPRDDGPPTTRALDVIELPAVPAEWSWLDIGGELYRVLSVRHFAVGGVHAEVQIEAAPKTPEEKGDTPSPFSPTSAEAAP